MMDVNQTLVEALGAFRSGDFSLARDLTRTIQRKQPGEPGSLRLVGQIDYLEGDIESAAKALEASLKSKPEQYSIWIKLGNVYADLGKFSKSEAAYTTALNHSPDPHLGFLWRAQTRALMGKLKEAWSDLDQVVKANPALGQTYRLMIKLKHPKSKTNEFAQKLGQKLSARILQNEDAIHAHYALAGFYEADHDFDKMWYHLGQANGLQNNRAGEWQEGNSQIIERSKEIFSSDFIKAAPSQDVKITPIFIVGLPRCGSTLLERMLAGHKDIAGTGETNLMPNLIGQIQVETLLSYPSGFEMLDRDQLKELSGQYLGGLAKRAGKAPFATDKLLSNSFFIGLILKLMPNAKIIHLQRNLLDNVFSIYKNHFWEAQSPEFCSLKSIGTYAKMTDQAMAHWKSVCGEAIFDISYEALVENPEKILKSTLEFVGLPWDANCLDHQSSKTLANTLSTVQVEGPLNTKSIGQGEKFKTNMAPFLEAYEKG